MYQPFVYGQNFNPAIQQNYDASSIFVPVNSEQEVISFPVGCGKSVNFKMQNAPYLYTKTMGFSQFEKPVIEKYRLLKEEMGAEPPKAEENPLQNKLTELSESFNALEEKVNSLKNEINSMKERRRNNEHNANGKSV